MSLEARKEQVRKDIARKEQYLETLEAMPDFDAMPDGSVVAMAVTYGRSKPCAVIAYRSAGGKWFLSRPDSPKGVGSDSLCEWLMSESRQLRSATVIGEFLLEPQNPFDLGAAISDSLRGQQDRTAGNVKIRGSNWKVLSGDYDVSTGREY